MSLKSIAIKSIAPYIKASTQRQSRNGVSDQDKWMTNLIQKAKHTQFGKDHYFNKIKSYSDFKQNIPVRDYEGLRLYIDRVVQGKANIVWPGRPKYFGKTSGTTSGVKYIPITKDSIGHHISSARNAILHYVADTRSNLFDGRMIFISGSPTLTKKSGIATGRLSGIVNHEIPSWVKGNQLPSWQTNCMEDWEIKLDNIVEETYNQDLRLISGIPPWVQMYYERLLSKTGKATIKEIFPNLELFIYGGVNYTPYKASIDRLHGQEIATLETYPASEGFIAYQDNYLEKSLMLNTNAGMFFEFVPIKDFLQDKPNRISLRDVEINKDYALILSTNAGLWGYNLGDTIRFVNLDPYRIIVSGRIKHFISAFGEHVISKEVEEAMQAAALKHNLIIHEFSVAPQVNPPDGSLPYHEWFVDMENTNIPISEIEATIDNAITKQNIYYKDLIDGQILRPLRIRRVVTGAFREYMDSIGKLGGQNKVPRLKNDRSLVEKLQLL